MCIGADDLSNRTVNNADIIGGPGGAIHILHGFAMVAAAGGN